MAKCRTVRTDKHIVLTDGAAKSKFRLANPLQQKIHQILVDDCEITEGRRCDYMLIIDKCKTEHYIELKGKNISHACSQIEATIQKLSANSATHPKYCFIVSSACPMITSSRQKQILKFKRTYNASLKIKNKVCNVNI